MHCYLCYNTDGFCCDEFDTMGQALVWGLFYCDHPTLVWYDDLTERWQYMEINGDGPVDV